MSRRLFFTRNRPANVDNHYVVGSGVGSKSRFVRSALRRRSSNNAYGKPCCHLTKNKKTQEEIYGSEKPIYCERENEIYNECGSACTATCDNPNPICTEQCVERCECKPGYVLFQDKCIPKNNCQNNYQCDNSFSSYQIKDTSMCCWTDDIGPDGSGCKNKNSVCYLDNNKGLLQVCPESNIINCTDVKYKCDTQKGSCVPDLSGTYASYNTCASQCSPQPPPPPPPSGLPAVKKVIYFNKMEVQVSPSCTPISDCTKKLILEQLNNAIDSGYNILNLSFIITEPNSKGIPIPNTKLYTHSNYATGWWKTDFGGTTDRDTTVMKEMIQQVHKNNALLFFSVGGSSDEPWTYYTNNPQQYGADIAEFVIKCQLDGIDFDIETAVYSQQQWLIDATTGAYNHFKQSNTANKKRYYISHAPQPPYFVNKIFPDYTEIYQDCSNMIDFLNVQFYNQGESSKYMDEDSLLNNTSSTNPSYKSLHTISNIPYEKIVIGKPALQSDLGNGNFGLVSDTSLNIWYTNFNDANNVIPSTMIWQYHNNSIYDINAVYNNLT